MTQQPKQWQFSDNAEESFTTWFNEIYGTYSHRCEWFFGDCEVKDEKTRKDLMYQWIHCAFAEGYRMGCFLSSDTEAGLEE